MFRQLHVRSALLSSLVTLMLLLAIAGFPGAGLGQATTVAKDAAAGPAAIGPAAQPCDVAPTFDAANFPAPAALPKTGTATMYPLVPGTEFILEGVSNDGSGLSGHKIISTVTDLTKMVNGVKTWVVWDRDYSLSQITQQYELSESELAFHVLDNSNNPWNLGEYPAVYKGGKFREAPDTWIAGLASATGKAKAQGGWILPGAPQVSQQTFLQAYAPGIIGDCGRVSAVDQHVCNGTTGACYDHVLVIDETTPPETPIQVKYYAPGVGNVKIGAINDPQNETLELTHLTHLGANECIAARNGALALEDQAYNHDTTQTVYDKTDPVQQTHLCEASPPTPTPQSAPGQSVYMPLVSKFVPTPTLPPAIFDDCQSDPNPAAAPNSPVRIVKVDKSTEQVTLENVSDKTVSLEDWNLCSINGNQEHDQIGGSIAAGQMLVIPNSGTFGIWNDSQRDDAALYDAAGYMVSYWIDQ